MKRQPHFETDSDRERIITRYVWKAVGWVIFWVLVFGGSAVAIGWVVAHGPWIDSTCNNFWN